MFLGDAASDSDNTLDQSLTSDLQAKSSGAPNQPTEEEDGAGDWQVQREALEDILAQLRQTVREKDEGISQLSSDGRQDFSQELASLQEENQHLQSELASLKSEKDELEMSISELDEQHQEAVDHLIAARDALHSQLSDSHQQVHTLLCVEFLHVLFVDVEVLLYVHRHRRLIRDGSPGQPPQLSHSS